MNKKSQDRFEILEQKLVSVGIPLEIAQKYAMFHKRWENCKVASEYYELPPDDNFKTLSKMYEIYCKQNNDQPIGELIIERFLLMPYSQVEATRKRIHKLFEKRFDEIVELYENEIHIYYLRPDEAIYIYELIAEYISDEEKLWQVFKRAAIAGEFFASSRIEAIVDTVGKKFAPEVIYESVVNGYLFYPYHTDPIEALKYLKKQFDKETIAKIIIENPEYLYVYKNDFYVEFMEIKEEIEKDISAIIQKYR